MNNTQNKVPTQCIRLLDQKSIPTKSQYGTEPNIYNGGRRSAKNDAKLESFWKRPNSKFFWLGNLQQHILI